MAGHGDTAVREPTRVVNELNREWAWLALTCEEVDGWAARHASLRGCRTLGEVLAAVRPDPDGVLGALLRESATGSLRASRVVLQAMLGKVVLMTRADPCSGGQAYVAAMWERIRTYPIERRPVQIAANLALDAHKAVCREGRAEAAVTPWPPGAAYSDLVDRAWAREHADHGSEAGPRTVGEVLKAALQLELIDGAAGNLLASVYADGLSSGEAARRHLISPAAVRKRCSRAVRRLAERSEELAEWA